MLFDGFDWDDANREKCRKHGLSIEDIEGLFRWEVLIAPDPRHSVEEERFKAIGRTQDGRRVLVVFTWRSRFGMHLLRPISARYTHRKEIAAHEEEIAKADERRGS
jgi:uncharacterized DUF497 family protein